MSEHFWRKIVTCIIWKMNKLAQPVRKPLDFFKHICKLYEYISFEFKIILTS